MTQSDFEAAMEDILDLPSGALKDTDTRETIETWTSLADVKMITYISSETGLEPDTDLLEAESFGDLVTALKSKGVVAG